MPMWRYQKCDTRDDVKTGMPDGWKVDVYKVTSGDSGKQYYVQCISSLTMDDIYLCNCPEGTFRAPLGIVGASAPSKICKHAENLAAFLKEKK